MKVELQKFTSDGIHIKKLEMHSSPLARATEIVKIGSKHK